MIYVREHRLRSSPGDIDRRLAGFTELVGTAITNSQARDELRQLAKERATLRRVATLVAGGASADEMFRRGRGRDR